MSTATTAQYLTANGLFALQRNCATLIIVTNIHTGRFLQESVKSAVKIATAYNIGLTDQTFLVRFKEHCTDPRAQEQKSSFARRLIDNNYYDMCGIDDCLKIYHVLRKVSLLHWRNDKFINILENGHITSAMKNFNLVPFPILTLCKIAELLH